MSEATTPAPLSEEIGSGPVGFETRARIAATMERVWEAATQCEHLGRVFAMFPERPLTDGGTLRVDWEGYSPDLIEMQEYVPNERLVFQWNAYKQPYRTVVTFETAQKEGKVAFTIREEGWSLTEDGVASALDHCEGWSTFVVRLQYYLEHGISPSGPASQKGPQ